MSASSTCRKQGRNLLAYLKMALSGMLVASRLRHWCLARPPVGYSCGNPPRGQHGGLNAYNQTISSLS